MKYFVKVVSFLLLAVYLLEAVCLAGTAGWGIFTGIDAHGNVGYGTLDGEPTPILDGLSRGFIILFIILLLFAIALVITGIVIMAVLYVKAAKNGSFKHYKYMSIVSLPVGVIYFFISLFITLAFVVFEGDGAPQDFLTKVVFTVFLANLFTEFFGILDLLSARQCIKDGL